MLQTQSSSLSLLLATSSVFLVVLNTLDTDLNIDLKSLVYNHVKLGLLLPYSNWRILPFLCLLQAVDMFSLTLFMFSQSHYLEMNINVFLFQNVVWHSVKLVWKVMVCQWKILIYSKCLEPELMEKYFWWERSEVQTEVTCMQWRSVGVCSNKPFNPFFLGFEKG